MDEKDLATTTEMVIRDFEIERKENNTMSEQELFDMLADQIAYMIEYRLEFLLSLMYRLDIDEAKVNEALSPGNETPANVALARIVLDRQKQRAFTKRFYKQDKLDDMDGLAF